MNSNDTTAKRDLLHECGILSPSSTLQQAIAEDSNRVTDWQWYVQQLSEPAEQIYCFERILYIEPTNAAALEALSDLRDAKPEGFNALDLSPVARLFRVWLRAD